MSRREMFSAAVMGAAMAFSLSGAILIPHAVDHAVDSAVADRDEQWKAVVAEGLRKDAMHDARVEMREDLRDLAEADHLRATIESGQRAAESMGMRVEQERVAACLSGRGVHGTHPWCSKPYYRWVVEEAR